MTHADILTRNKAAIKPNRDLDAKMITVETLRAKNACCAQVALFEKHFPAGAPLTVETALSVAHLFSWAWASENLLDPKNRVAYYAAIKTAWDAYNAAIKTAWKAYDAATKPAWGVYEVACATAFAEIYIKQEAAK